MKKISCVCIITFILLGIYGYGYCNEVGFISATTKCDVGGDINIIYVVAGERNGCSDGVSGPETLCAVDARDDEDINVTFQVGHPSYDAILEIDFLFEDSRKRHFKFQALSTPISYNAQLNGADILPETFVLNSSTSNLMVFVPAGQINQLQWELTITSAISEIDQVNPYANATHFEAGELDIWQQEVTVGMEGYLVGIDLYWHINPRINNNKLDFFINVGSAWQADANDFQSVITFTVQNDWNYIDVSSAGLYFLPGDQFVIGVQNTYDHTSLGGSYYDQYPAGDLFLSGQNFTSGLWDLAFRTHVEAPPEVDTDADSIPDDQDACPFSNLSETVVIDGWDTGVGNVLLDDGCTISDLISECAEGADNHSEFVSAVTHTTNTLKKEGILSGKDKGRIQKGAATAAIP